VRLLSCCLLPVAVACTPTPPPFWAQGGAPLDLIDAVWERNSGEPVTVSTDGRVERDGDLLFQFDAAGRVFDEDNEPIAVLGPDGHLVGTGDEYLGRIGLRNASPPWSRVAWLRVADDGALMLFNDDGRPVFGGEWRGCKAHGVRSCTLVSHVLLLDAVKRELSGAPYYPVTFGVGVGVWY